MDSTFNTVKNTLSKVPIVSILWIITIVLIVGLVASIFLKYPTFEVAPKAHEGFFGGVVKGAGHPDCLRDLNAGPELLAAVSAPDALSSPDYAEFQVLLSKIGCLKKDLMSPSGIVNATLYQPYENAHDREPVSEVAATCLNRTIAPRDLDIIFKTWRDRGGVLLKRLCTLANLTEKQVSAAETLFASAIADVYDVAKGRCIATAGEIKAEVDSARPFEPENVKDLGEYNGYYSGWTGQI